MADAWYYSCDEQPRGPISIADLRILAASGTLKPMDLVWTPGMSQWAPASLTRGLFPPAPKVLPASPAPTPPPSPSQPALEGRQSRRDDDILRISRAARARTSPRVRSSGTRALIAFGIAFAVVVCIAGAALIVEMANDPRHRAQAVKGFQPQPPVQPQPAPVFKFGRGAIPANGAYEVDLNLKVLEHTQVLHFNQKELVHITVTTTDWGLGDEPDVDLFVYGPNGALVAFDDGPDKDCDAFFLAVVTGDYTVVVRLDQGTQAHCTVRY